MGKFSTDDHVEFFREFCSEVTFWPFWVNFPFHSWNCFPLLFVNFGKTRFLPYPRKNLYTVTFSSFITQPFLKHRMQVCRISKARRRPYTTTLSRLNLCSNVKNLLIWKHTLVLKPGRYLEANHSLLPKVHRTIFHSVKGWNMEYQACIMNLRWIILWTTKGFLLSIYSDVSGFRNWWLKVWRKNDDKNAWILAKLTLPHPLKMVSLENF